MPIMTEIKMADFSILQKTKEFPKRILLKKNGSDELFEAIIAEISPSGKYMRVEGCFPELPGTHGRWVSAETYSVAEEIPLK